MQNKSVTLPINNNRHSTHTWEERGKPNRQPLDGKTQESPQQYNILSPIHRNIAAAQRMLLECVCVCGLFSFPLSAFFSLLSLSQVVLCWTAPCCCVCISPAGRNSEGIFILFPPFLPGLTDAVCV